MISACFCKFKAHAHHTWEYGITITREFNSNEELIIIDYYGQIVKSVHTVELDWTHSLDGNSRETYITSQFNE